MAVGLQNLLIFSLVAAAAGFVSWQLVRTLRGKSGGAGSCCSKGCGPGTKPVDSTQRIVFLPVEALHKRK